MTTESDPTGRSAHDPGAKLDANKLQAGLLLDFANALEAVAKVATYGARKYSAGGWLKVPDGINRYADAEMRHKLERAKGEACDQESGLPHRWHEVWNALAQLELELRDKPFAIEAAFDPEKYTKYTSNIDSFRVGMDHTGKITGYAPEKKVKPFATRKVGLTRTTAGQLFDSVFGDDFEEEDNEGEYQVPNVTFPPEWKAGGLTPLDEGGDAPAGKDKSVHTRTPDHTFIVPKTEYMSAVKKLRSIFPGKVWDKYKTGQVVSMSYPAGIGRDCAQWKVVEVKEGPRPLLALEFIGRDWVDK